LVLWFQSPAQRELDDVGNRECEFALVVANDVLFFLYRFGRSMGWSDAPYSWWLVPPNQRVLPPAPERETPTALQVTVVDAAAGIVLALRAVQLSLPFTRALHAAIRVQAETPWADRLAYDRQVAETYRRWPDPRAMLAGSCARMRAQG
jgi:hypothetical protein